MVAAEDEKFSTIRHATCEHFLSGDEGTERCGGCSNHRKALHSMLSRQKAEKSTDSRTAPSSHVNYRFLSSSEKDQRLQNLHTLQRQTKLQLDRMSARISRSTEMNGIEVDGDMHADLVSIMENASGKKFDNTFQKIFWEQQQKAAEVSNPRLMRWHPLMIKWCLYLRHLSGGAYDMLRESGCVTLPSQRTLRDYTYYVRACTGEKLASNIKFCYSSIRVQSMCRVLE